MRERDVCSNSKKGTALFLSAWIRSAQRCSIRKGRRAGREAADILIACRRGMVLAGLGSRPENLPGDLLGKDRTNRRDQAKVSLLTRLQTGLSRGDISEEHW